jgi:hypothetical protein
MKRGFLISFAMPASSSLQVDAFDLPAKTWRQQVPPEVPNIHRLDMGSPPFHRESIEHATSPPG